jgi:hypothetical protein
MNDDFDNHDPLWKLLGQAGKPTPRPSFVRDVMRSIRTQEKPESAWRQFLRWMVPATAAAAAAVAFGMIFSDVSEEPVLTSSDLTTEFAEIAALDELVASSAGWGWQDVAP